MRTTSVMGTFLTIHGNTIMVLKLHRCLTPTLGVMVTPTVYIVEHTGDDVIGCLASL